MEITRILSVQYPGDGMLMKWFHDCRQLWRMKSKEVLTHETDCSNIILLDFISINTQRQKTILLRDNYEAHCYFDPVSKSSVV